MNVTTLHVTLSKCRLQYKCLAWIVDHPRPSNAFSFPHNLLFGICKEESLITTFHEPSTMLPRSLFRLGQHLRGTAGTYRITEQISEFIYIGVYVLVPPANAHVNFAQHRLATNKKVL